MYIVPGNAGIITLVNLSKNNVIGAQTPTFSINSFMELIFIYNAQKGRLNSLIDYIHKTVSPGTYSCNLCAITHNFKKKIKWDNFIQNFPHKIKFYYKDHLNDLKLNNYKNELPCCLIYKDEKYSLLINKTTMEILKNEEELIELIKSKFA